MILPVSLRTNSFGGRRGGPRPRNRQPSKRRLQTLLTVPKRAHPENGAPRFAPHLASEKKPHESHHSQKKKRSAVLRSLNWSKREISLDDFSPMMWALTLDPGYPHFRPIRNDSIASGRNWDLERTKGPYDCPHSILSPAIEE